MSDNHSRENCFNERKSGILLHPTSLPGEYGIGTFGKAAYRWIDVLCENGQGLWQILPLGPTGYGNSPYQSYSAFAGNPLLIDLRMVQEAGWLDENVSGKRFDFDENRVDYDWVAAYKMPLLKSAFLRFSEHAGKEEKGRFEIFCHEEREWLEDYALFMALKKEYRGKIWYEWDTKIVKRDPKALAHKKKVLEEEIAFQKFLQYLFFGQWKRLKAYANAKGVQIIGDLPIYVSEDSSDVWAHPALFQLDESCRPTAVAGVPPDYFSATGQRWGNPLYDWNRMEEEDFAWWILRLQKSLALYDIIRIDHFRGFVAYWSIPAEEETAVNGEWVKGPGRRFFKKLKERLGHLPIIAEDLGVITPEVERLRDEFNLLGMKILQFAFDGNAQNPYLPHNGVRDSVIYTGTHDNDTTVGWFESIDNKAYVTSYLSRSDREIHWAMIREALASVSLFALIPLQDILGLGSNARMNRPGHPENNWCWRVSEAQLQACDFERVGRMARLYGRE
ncbi:4-alpha-glucanotransferase [Hydrogenimonas urashimensis]|uniref:4-alpha-glucanotransferase n=1 Tax=Hydrogenimonas urashimensis TaxID=2740515 RepID=UPI00191676E6|nr:4-alpha-glucanotransferase [Hydrogenimonas urashimensis]